MITAEDGRRLFRERRLGHRASARTKVGGQSQNAGKPRPLDVKASEKRPVRNRPRYRSCVCVRPIRIFQRDFRQRLFNGVMRSFQMAALFLGAAVSSLCHVGHASRSDSEQIRETKSCRKGNHFFQRVTFE
jgi:hypothetical protein